MTIDDDEGMTRRLASALESDARRNPLPADFAATLTDGLPDQSRGLLSLLAAPTLAVTAVLAIAGVALVLQLLPGSTISGAPASSSISSPAPPGTAHFSGLMSASTISFDYPDDWRIIEQNTIMRHYQVIPVVLGTGDWAPDCQPAVPTDGVVSGITCGPTDVFTVGPGQIVVEIYQWNRLGDTASATAPPGAIQLPSGLWATVTDTATSSTWQIYNLGVDPPTTIEARFADPGAEQLRAAVRSLVQSLRVARPMP